MLRKKGRTLNGIESVLEAIFFHNSLSMKWLPGLGSNLGAILITNDLSPVDGCFNADCLTNSMHADHVHRVSALDCARSFN